MDLEHLAPELVTKINCTYSNEAATKLVVAALESVQSETERRTLEPAPPDPLLVALAGLFAKTWNFNPPAILGVAIEVGLVEYSSGPGNSHWQPTELGRAALAESGR